MTPGPFVKWVGSKRVVAAQVIAQFPPMAEVERYVEPFVGGGSIFFAFRRAGWGGVAVLGDANHDLMLTYAQVKAAPWRLVKALRAHERFDSLKHFMRVRGEQCATAEARAARFIYLNKTCFNGLYRVNAAGQFNVPYNAGHSAIVDEANIHACSAALASCLTTHGDTYAATVGDARAGDLIYLDPPYPPLSPTANFTGYTVGAFLHHEHEVLAADFRHWARAGARVVLSNADVPFVRKLYKGFPIVEVESRRSVSSKASTRGKVGELVIRSWR